jgi:heme exporter protein C
LTYLTMQIPARQNDSMVLAWEVLALGAIIYETVVFVFSGWAEQLQQAAACQLALSVVTISCFAGNFACSITYLARRKPEADALAAGVAQVGFACCSLLLIVGAITTHYLFTTWWRRDDDQAPVYLLLWLIYASYMLLRHHANLGQSPVLAAVFGVFAFLDLPMAYFSASQGKPKVSWLMQRAWLNSATSLLVRSLAYLALASVLTWVRYRVERQKQKFDDWEAISEQ